MGVSFMKEGRTEFASGDIRGGTVDEKIEAFNGYISYSGKFEIQGDKVIHVIEVSLFPNWIGERQERFYSFDDDILTLSTPLQLVGGMMLSSHVGKSERLASPDPFEESVEVFTDDAFYLIIRIAASHKSFC